MSTNFVLSYLSTPSTFPKGAKIPCNTYITTYSIPKINFRLTKTSAKTETFIKMLKAFFYVSLDRIPFTYRVVIAIAISATNDAAIAMPSLGSESYLMH